MRTTENFWWKHNLKFLYYCSLRINIQNFCFESIQKFPPNGFPLASFTPLYLLKIEIFLSLTSKKIFSRPPIKSLKLDEDSELVSTQSQNTSAKMAIVADEILTTFHDTQNKGQNPWNQLDDRFYATRIGIATQHSAFYYRMIKDTVDKLTDTGIIKHLIKTRVLIRRKYPKDVAEPKILNIEDLLFGFNIFLGFCLICGIIFWIELILGMKIIRTNLNLVILRRKLMTRTLKFAKIHPMTSIEVLIFSRRQRKVTNLLNEFRIKKKTYSEEAT